MKRFFFLRSTAQPGNLAFLLVVIGGYAIMLSVSAVSDNLPRLLLWLALGLIYLGLGTIGWDRLEASGSRRLALVYFAVMIALSVLISYLGYGAGWLISVPLVAHSVVIFPKKGVILVGLLVLLAAVLPFVGVSSPEQLYSTMISLAAALVFVAIFAQITVSEQRSREEVERLALRLSESNQKLDLANQQLREYALQVEELAVAEERNRLAREIHDGLGHYLTAINMQIKAAQAVSTQDADRAQDALGKAQALAQDALADVRRSVAALRSPPAEARPLPEALAALVEETRATGLRAALEINGDSRPLTPQAELALYRAAQEGLTNVRKHALASCVTVRLNYLNGPRTCLVVQDDGQGSVQIGDGFGLLGLRERATLLGGELRVQAAPGQGFTLELEIPG